MSTPLSRARAAQRRKDAKLPKIHSPRKKGQLYNPPAPVAPYEVYTRVYDNRIWFEKAPFIWVLYPIALLIAASFWLVRVIVYRIMRRRYF